MQLGPTEPISDTNLAEQTSQQDSASLSQDQTQTQTATQTKQPVAFDRLFDRLTSSENLLPNILLFGGVFLMVVLMMRLLRKNTQASRRRTNQQGSPSQRIAQMHAEAQASITPSTKVMVEAEDMARRLGAILDNKAARLELLIEEADRKLSILNRSLAATPRSESSLEPQQSQSTQPPTTVAATRTIDPTLLDRARLEQDYQERQSRVAGRIEPEPIAPASMPIDQPTLDPTQQFKTKVLSLADAGMSNIEIAHELKQPIGQVELILNLRKQQG